MNSKKGYEAPKLGVVLLSSLDEALIAACRNAQQLCTSPANRGT